MEIVDYITVTTSANSAEYIFQIALSSLGLHRLKRRNLLGGFVSIAKTKYEFLNDLRDALTEEILIHLEKMSEGPSDER